MKQLIINADDFGMSREFNLAISDLLNKGCISSASLMPNGIAYNDACGLIKSKNLKNIGVHLTLTRDSFSAKQPLLYKSLTCAKSLSDKDGYLYPSTDMLRKNADLDELKEEIVRQITKLQTDGIDITHIDNHMYSLIPKWGYTGYRVLFQVIRDLKIKNLGVRITRHYYENSGFRYVWGGRKVWLYANIYMKILHLRGIDYSFSFPYKTVASTLENKETLLDSFLKNMKDGVTELHFHPCVFSEQLKAYNPFWEDRVKEYELLQNLNKDMLLQRYGIVLANYNNIK